MNRSVLLRLLPTSRTGARLAGTAEVVDTGERQAFRDAEDLVSLLVRLHADPALAPHERDGPRAADERSDGPATRPS